MNHKDKLCLHYKDILEGTYDCVDRLVLNGYYPLGHFPVGFRTWFRNLKGSEEDLTNTTLIRMAGKFSSRIRAFCKKKIYQWFILKQASGNMRKQKSYCQQIKTLRDYLLYLFLKPQQ